MSDQLKTSLMYIFGLVFISIIAWQIQNVLFFSWDNSILLHETERFLSGGSYVKDFFETSPPMVLYLYSPIVVFSKFFATSLITTFRVAIFIYIFISLWLYQSLFNQFTFKTDTQFKTIAFLSLTAILLIFPSYELGQRDCLFMILSIPYLVAAALCIENTKISKVKATLIGLLAGLGIGIKPHFILTPILIELYVIISTKNGLKCFRLETITMFMVLLSYLLIVFYIHSDYLHTIVPYAMRNYYNGISVAWQTIIFNFINVSGCFSLLFYLTQFKFLGVYKTFITVIGVSLLSFMLIFTSQRVMFYYHAIPSVSFTFFLNILLITIVFRQALTTQRMTTLALLAMLNFEFLIDHFWFLWPIASSHLSHALTVIGCLMTLCFLSSQLNSYLINKIILGATCLIASLLFYYHMPNLFLIFLLNIFFIFIAFAQFPLSLSAIFLKQEKILSFRKPLTIIRVITLSTLAILNIEFLFYFHSLLFFIFNIQFLISIVCCCILLYLISKSNNHFTYHLKGISLGVFSILIVAVFYYPINLSRCMYLFNADYAQRISPILTYLKTKTSRHSVYLFSSSSGHFFPLVDYAKATSVSRFPFFWMLPGLINRPQSNELNNPNQLQQRLRDKNLLIEMVTEDLRIKKPDYIFIDVSKAKINIKLPFEFLPYFFSSKSFQTEWKNYDFTTLLSENSRSEKRFQFAVYKRHALQY